MSTDPRFTVTELLIAILVLALAISGLVAIVQEVNMRSYLPDWVEHPNRP